MAAPTQHHYHVEGLTPPRALRILGARMEDARGYTPAEAAELTGIVAVALESLLRMRIDLANLAGLGGILLDHPAITDVPQTET